MKPETWKQGKEQMATDTLEKAAWKKILAHYRAWNEAELRAGIRDAEVAEMSGFLHQVAPDYDLRPCFI